MATTPQPTPQQGLPPGFSGGPAFAEKATVTPDDVRQAAKEHGLDPDILDRQVRQESNYDPNAVSRKGAVGLMQLMPPTAEKWGVDPHDPQDNLHGGMAEMRELVDHYGGDYAKALAAYNAGRHNVEKYGGVPPFPETQDYVTKVMGEQPTAAAKPGLPAGFTASMGEAPPPVSSPKVASPPTEETGVLASLKRNTVGAVHSIYHAFADPPTPEEVQHFNDLNGRMGIPKVVSDADLSPKSLAWYRMFEKPSNELSAKGSAEYHEGLADLKSSDPGRVPVVETIGPRQNLGLATSGVVDKVLAQVPGLGPFINSIAERAEKGDVSGAATDIATAWAAEHAPGLVVKGTSKVTKGWDVAHATGLLDQTAKDFTAAIPPTKSTPYTPADYRATRVYLENEHTTAPVSTVEGVRDAADSAIGKIEDHIAGRIAEAPQDLITTNPRSDVMATLSKNPRGASFALAGLKELEDFGLEEPKTVSEADAIRRQLNAENKAVLKRNNYDQATARAADPGFAAREVAAESIRNGLYDALKQRGFPGIDDLRREEGSLIKVRNAAQAQVFNGDKVVSSSTIPTTAQRVGQGVVRVGARLGGAEVAGWPGYIVGREVGDVAANAIGPQAMTRDALVNRAFQVKTSDFLGYPQGRLQALPIPEVPKGTQLPLQPQPPEAPTSTPPPAQGKLFNEPITLKSIGERLRAPFAKNPEAGVLKVGGKNVEHGSYFISKEGELHGDPLLTHAALVDELEPSGKYSKHWDDEKDPNGETIIQPFMKDTGMARVLKNEHGLVVQSLGKLTPEQLREVRTMGVDAPSISYDINGKGGTAYSSGDLVRANNASGEFAASQEAGVLKIGSGANKWSLGENASHSGFFDHKILDPQGNDSGARFTGYINNRGVANVDMFGHENNPNFKLGISGIRDVIDDFKSRNPKVTALRGDRISGAEAGDVTTPLKARNINASGESAASQEAINRPGVAYKVGPGGVTYLGKDIDANLKPGEAVIRRLPDGTLKVHNTNGLTDSVALQRYGGKVTKAIIGGKK